MESENYYIGLDIGTDSIGYAAADESYRLLKYKGEPVWGSHIIEEANLKYSQKKSQKLTLISTSVRKKAHFLPRTPPHQKDYSRT